MINTIKEEIETKPSGIRFMKFSAFVELRPLVLSTVRLADSLIEKNPNHKDLLLELRKQSVDCLLYLVDGYNKYHCDDKAILYGNARSAVAKIQCLLIFLSDLSLINSNLSNKMVTKYEAKMMIFNGLIRKMEDRLHA